MVIQVPFRRREKCFWFFRLTQPWFTSYVRAGSSVVLRRGAFRVTEPTDSWFMTRTEGSSSTCRNPGEKFEAGAYWGPRVSQSTAGLRCWNRTGPVCFPFKDSAPR